MKLPSPKKRLLATLLSFLPGIILAAPMVNDASIWETYWTPNDKASLNAIAPGYTYNPGTDGPVPTLLTGEPLTLSMVGATGGSTSVTKNTLKTIGTDYIITARVMVDQFRGDGERIGFISANGNQSLLQSSFSTNTMYITAPYGLNTTIDLDSLGLTVAEGQYYTWQFQIHEDSRTNSSPTAYDSVSIYRRDNDIGAAWDTVAEDLPIHNGAGQLQLTYGTIGHSASGNQGIMKQDYLIVGVVPEASTLSLFSISLGLLLIFRGRRNLAR